MSGEAAAGGVNWGSLIGGLASQYMSKQDDEAAKGPKQVGAEADKDVKDRKRREATASAMKSGAFNISTGNTRPMQNAAMIPVETGTPEMDAAAQSMYGQPMPRV